MTRHGKLEWDGYTSYVESGLNTKARLSEELTKAAVTALKELSINLQNCRATYGAVDKSVASTLAGKYQIPLDTVYNKDNIAVPIGFDAEMFAEAPTWESMAETLQKVDEAFKKAGLYFDYYTVRLRKEGTDVGDVQNLLMVEAFPAAQLSAENLPSLLKAFSQKQAEEQEKYNTQEELKFKNKN